MTQEEKVAMLKEAGVWDVIGYPTCIDKLFDLIAAHEREACAKVCEQDEFQIYETAERCAEAIRSRSSERKSKG